jgi:hypothetical protein
LISYGKIKQVHEEGNETENREYEKKKIGELQKRLANALASPHHRELKLYFIH